jgi:hypothetical protein
VLKQNGEDKYYQLHCINNNNNYYYNINNILQITNSDDGDKMVILIY